MVTVNVARVGDVVAMVDSGAMVCVVRRDMVDVALTVRYGDKVVDLRRVKVVESSLYDLILGTEWIEKGNVVIFGDSRRLSVHVLSDERRASLVSQASGSVAQDVQQSPVCLVTGFVPVCPKRAKTGLWRFRGRI